MTFCFATTHPGQIIPPLRSRLRSIVVKPLPADLAIRLLRERAEADGLAYDPPRSLCSRASSRVIPAIC